MNRRHFMQSILAVAAVPAVGAEATNFAMAEYEYGELVHRYWGAVTQDNMDTDGNILPRSEYEALVRKWAAGPDYARERKMGFDWSIQ